MGPDNRAWVISCKASGPGWDGPCSLIKVSSTGDVQSIATPHIYQHPKGSYSALHDLTMVRVDHGVWINPDRVSNGDVVYIGDDGRYVRST